MTADTDAPHTLLCVTGLTPQVVTETLYALAQEGAHALPDRIEVITTTEGRRRLALTLLAEHGGHGYLDRLCADYGIDRGALAFDVDSIHVVGGADDEPLADIVTEADNAAAADRIHERIRTLTEQPGRLHVSLAGGRKTMGFYAGYSLSLYGRGHDRLSHVLVNPPFESHPDFFYPPPTPATLQLPGRNDIISTAEAEVRLAELPFVRLREELGEELPHQGLSFSEAVERAQQVLIPPQLTIDLTERTVTLQGQPITLSATHFLWLTWLADRARQEAPAIAFDEAAVDELTGYADWLEGRLSQLHESLASARKEIEREGRSNYFERTRSRLNKAIAERSGLPTRAAARYQIHTHSSRPQTTYGLKLEPEQIRIEGEP
ncbi:CRISPR-associated ring nuclease Csm6 [Halorhodospira halophila]|uniref:CRISPR-associated protein, Csx6 family n=1 Tax=Halorhodospira halophila (strain DSM 244 / SL1) TaxID=349124 RepID=A1WUP8_HALHL|nr:CRISPR-associated ring nuclease Csm6 [Halorhodospira halophila]ABM61410.1 CRISPR-associated protein, Csx6 family [Halorhodospira halophila SL1]MBK1728652.1 TIGR02584 family CRISPR-associated protein [Halorhodospira halophila]